MPVYSYTGGMWSIRLDGVRERIGISKRRTIEYTYFLWRELNGEEEESLRMWFGYLLNIFMNSFCSYICIRERERERDSLDIY